MWKNRLSHCQGLVWGLSQTVDNERVSYGKRVDKLDIISNPQVVKTIAHTCGTGGGQ
jgi:hypothetical protein